MGDLQYFQLSLGTVGIIRLYFERKTFKTKNCRVFSHLENVEGGCFNNFETAGNISKPEIWKLIPSSRVSIWWIDTISWKTLHQSISSQFQFKFFHCKTFFKPSNNLLSAFNTYSFTSTFSKLFFSISTKLLQSWKSSWNLYRKCIFYICKIIP